MTPEKAIKKAVDLFGGQSSLARACGVKPQAVQQWVASGRCPAKRAAEIERLTLGKVTREDLRPDVFLFRPKKATA